MSDTPPIIVPDDNSTRAVIDDTILRETGYRPIGADVILRALRLHSDAHGVGAASIDALWQQLRACEANRDFDRAQHARQLDELRAQHAHTLDALPRADAALAEAGRRVMQAERQRRKTVRVDQLLDGLPRVVA